MKIALCEFHQETNSFNPIKTTLADYKKVYLREGEEMFDLRGRPAAMAGKFDAIADAGGAEIIPLIAMFAQSGGTAEHAVVDYFLEKTVSGLKANLPLDGVFVGLHGATQSDASDDVSGDILEAIREIVGKDCVITASTDLHANVTEKCVRNADFITGYHTYPHIDIYETGYRAAKLGLDKIMKKQDLSMAFFLTVLPKMGDLDNNIFFFLQKCHTYSHLKKKFTFIISTHPFSSNIALRRRSKYIQISLQISFVYFITQIQRNFFITITGISF